MDNHKVLSDKEKIQFIELQKAREKIVNQLNEMDIMSQGSSMSYSSNSRSGFGSITQKMSTRGHSKAKSSSNRLKMSKTANYINELSESTQNQPFMRTGIDMIPIMTNFGDSALGGLRSKSSSSKSGKIKLPIFKLPAIDFRRSNSADIAVSSKEKINIPILFIPFTSLSTLRRAIVKMIQQINDSPNVQLAGIQRFLNISPDEIGMIEYQLNKVIQISSGSIPNKKESGFTFSDVIMGLAENEMVDNKEKTVFSSASQWVIDVSETDNDNNNMDNNTLSSTATFGMFPSIRLSSSQQQQQKNVYNITTAKGSRTKREKGKDGNAKDLTMELVSSLKNMERHTLKIKSDIANIQKFVNFSDQRARMLLNTVAATKLQTALYVMVKKDLRRGLLAWIWQFKGQQRQKKNAAFIRMLVMRNTIVGLNEVVRKLLKDNFRIWKLFCESENQRIRKERILWATVKIQSVMRAYLAKGLVNLKRQRKKYQKMYNSVIVIQTFLRGKRIRWKFLEKMLAIKKSRSSLRIQRLYRGFKARRRVKAIRQRRKKFFAAVCIQKIARGRIGRRRVALVRREKEQRKYVLQVQRLVRGFLGRRRVRRLLVEKVKNKFVIRIQKVMRGAVMRMNKDRKIAEINDYKYFKRRAVVLIQAAYRGHRARVMYRIAIFQIRKRKALEYKSATKINTLIRIFISKAQLRQLKADRLEKWMSDARNWQEMWEEESQTWFYLNHTTGDTVWEPSVEGYVKYDGKLVLANGEILDDPLHRPAKTTDEETEEDGGDVTEKQKRKLCVECVERIAIRNCVECGDKFCTKCYKTTHATGTRRRHTFTNIGPIDCTECELVLAERFCVPCDESFCDPCWRKVHSRGKRVFHPFCEVSAEGRIDSRIFTMDGQQLSDYDATYSQERVEDARKEEYGGDASIVALHGDGSTSEYPDEEWSQFVDDNGYDYWYNNYTGESQYESPFEAISEYGQ